MATKQGEMSYRDVLPSGSGTQFFFARILGSSHVGAAMGGSNADSVLEINATDRQKYTTYAWEEVVPETYGSYMTWRRGSKSSYSFYDSSHDEIPPPKVTVQRDPDTGKYVGHTVDWTLQENGQPHPGPPGGALNMQVANLEQYFIENNIVDLDGNRPDASLRDRSYFRDMIDEGVPRINDIDYLSDPPKSTDWKDHFKGCMEFDEDGNRQGECEPMPASTEDATKTLFGGNLAFNISEYNRYHNPASPVGTIVLMQEVEVGGEGSGAFRYMFDAPETRGTVLAKIIRAHPIGPTLPNVDDEEDPEFRMWAYEWREVDFQIKPDLYSTSIVAKQHHIYDSPSMNHEADQRTAVTGFDYPIRDGADYRVGGKRISEEPIIEVGGFTANADVEHWASTRLGTGEVEGFDSYTFNIVKEKGLFKDTILDKLKLYQEWEEYNNSHNVEGGDPRFPREVEARDVIFNEVRILNSAVFGPTAGKENEDGTRSGDFSWDIALTYEEDEDGGPDLNNPIYPSITDEDILAVERYLMWANIPRSNPIALNTCELYNVSSDNEFIDVGMRGATGNRRLVPRYISPGVDMSRLPRFMRVQPIRPGSIVHMNFAATGFYSSSDIRFPEGHAYAGSPVPLQNRPNGNPPMFTCPNAIDTLDDPCAFKQLPFPFKLENVNEQFLNSVQPIQGSYIVNDDLSQPNP